MKKSSGIIKFLTGLTVLYLTYATFYYFSQRSILFPTEYARIKTQIASQVPDRLKIFLEYEDGKTESWFLPPTIKNTPNSYPVMIVGHGNGDVIDNWYNISLILREAGIGILLIEYPGYGRSSGKPSQENISRVFVEHYNEAVSKFNINEKKIVFLGQSIGGGVVCDLVYKRPPAAIILISTFTELGIFATQYYLPKFLIKDPFDNLSIISNYIGPTLFIHGLQDELIPVEESRKLMNKAKNGRLVELSGGHNLRLGKTFWKKYIIPFLRKNDIL